MKETFEERLYTFTRVLAVIMLNLSMLALGGLAVRDVLTKNAKSPCVVEEAK